MRSMTASAPGAGRRWPAKVRRLGVALAAVVVASGALGQALPERPDTAHLQRQAAEIFNPARITAADGDLIRGCDTLQLCMQAVSVAIIVAAMVAKLRKDHEAAEGIAAVILKVGFIATLPLWQSAALEASASIAHAIGYPAAGVPGEPSPAMTGLWKLAGEWLPPNSPFLDAAEAQNGSTAPASGHEQEWALQAWNWARGFGFAAQDNFHALWQTFTGGLRGFLVFVGCAALGLMVSIAIVVSYLGEVVRLLLFFGGCAVAPVFIAGVGTDVLRQQSVRFLLALVSIACWPIAWALANVVTAAVVQGTTTWMDATTVTALGLTAAASVPALATAAPMIAWSVLLIFGALTLVICGFSLGSVIAGPYLMTKALAAGARVFGGWTSATVVHETNRGDMTGVVRWSHGPEASSIRAAGGQAAVLPASRTSFAVTDGDASASPRPAACDAGRAYRVPTHAGGASAAADRSPGDTIAAWLPRAPGNGSASSRSKATGQ